MLPDMGKARIVITNYHAFKRREQLELSSTNRSLLQGRGQALDTLETEGQMLRRVMPELMGIRSVLVLNDEAHHWYREKPGEQDEGTLFPWTMCDFSLMDAIECGIVKLPRVPVADTFPVPNVQEGSQQGRHPGSPEHRQEDTPWGPALSRIRVI